MHFILMGPPGAGKGTQATQVADRLGLEHVNVGDMLRNAIRRETELGGKIKSYVEAGELVPDPLINDLMKGTLEDIKEEGRGFVVDGYPRNLVQAEAMDEILNDLGLELDTVIYLEVAEAELVRRLSGRRVCRSCGATFHIEYDPPEQSGVCDDCGGELYQRQDDEEETVKQRLRVYRRETQPLIQFYREKGILDTIDGGQSIEEVHRSLLAALGEL